MEDRTQVLYKALTEKGLYTKTYDEFVGQFSDPVKRESLHGVLTKKGLYTKSIDEFNTQFFPTDSKKKIQTELPLEDSTVSSGESSTPSVSSSEAQSPLQFQTPDLSLNTPELGFKEETPETRLQKGFEGTLERAKTRETSVMGDLARSFYSGSVRMVGGAGEIPSLITKTVQNATIKPIMKAMGATEEEAQQQINYINSLNTFGQSLQLGDEAQKALEKEAQRVDAKMWEIEGGIAENIGKGNWLKAGELTLRGVVQSLPYMALTATTAGAGSVATLGVVGATSAAQQYGQLDGSGKTEGTKQLNSWLYGGFEAVGELATAGILRGIGNSFRKGLTKEVNQDFIKGGAKELAKAFGLESSSEAVTQLGQNLTDIITGVDPNRNIFTGVLDASIVGGVSGGGLGTVGIGANLLGRAMASDKEVKQVQDGVVQQQVLIEQAEQTDSDPVKRALLKSVKDLKYEAEKVMDDNYKLAQSLSQQQKEQVAELYSVWNDLQGQIDEGKIAPDRVPVIENTIKGIKDQIQGIKEEVLKAQEEAEKAKEKGETKTEVKAEDKPQETQVEKPAKVPFTEINAENISEIEKNYISSLKPEEVESAQENIDLIKDYLNEGLNRQESTGSEGILQQEVRTDGGGLTTAETEGDVSSYPTVLAGRRDINRNAQLTPDQQLTQRLAPNGQKSNLSDKDFDYVRTPEFKARFGDWQKGEGSLVLDRNGEPLKVYHGAPQMYLDGVNPEKTPSKKAYFSTNKSEASVYARFGQKQPVVYEGFLSLTEEDLSKGDKIDKLPGFEETDQEFLVGRKEQFIPTRITKVEAKRSKKDSSVQKTEMSTELEQTGKVNEGKVDAETTPNEGKNTANNEESPVENGNVPPEPPIAEKQAKYGGNETKERTIGVRALNSDKIDQDIKDGISKEGIDYVPRGRGVRSEEAREIIDLFSKEEGGLDKISEMVYNTQNGIAGDTRTFLNVHLANKYNQLKQASAAPIERDRLRQKVVDLYMFGMEQGTKGGQQVEAQKEWGKVFGSSPEMLQALARKHIEDKRSGFFQSKEAEIKSAKELLDELFNSEEGKKRIEEEVSAEISKIGTSNFGAEGKKKVDDFFKGLLIDPKQQQFYDALLGIPIAAWNGSVLAVKNAVLLGMDVASAIQKGVEHLDKWYKENHEKGAVPSPEWNRKEYESHMREKLGGLKKEVPVADEKKKPATKPKAKPKAQPTQEEMVDKLLEKMAGFATRKQLQNFVKDYFQEHFEKGFVSDQRYKDLLAKALGLEYMTPKTEAELTASAQALGEAQKKVQELADAFDKILATDPNSPEFKGLRKELDKLKKDVDKANFNAQKANQRIKTMLTDEPGLWDKVGTLIQGNLLVPASLLRNVYGNVFMGIPRATRFGIMNAVDAVLSMGGRGKEMLKIDPVKNPTLYRLAQKLPNAERTVKMGASMRGYREGVMRGLVEGLRQVKTGQLEDDYQKKEIQRGLEPIKAAIRIWDTLKGEEKRKWDQTVGDVLEALPAGYMGEGMFRLLNLGDKPFRRAAEQARLSEIADIKGYTGLRREQFMSNPDNASLQDAQKAGDIAVYTNDNIVSKLIQYANQTISKGQKSNEESIKTTSAIAKALFKLGKATTIPYVRTPVNLMAEAFEYSIPAYSLARSIESAYKGRRRESLDYFGKAVVGTIVSSLAIALLKNGVMTPGSSDDEKTKQAEYTGKEGYRLNIDAMQRMLQGENTEWQDGDNTVTLKGYGTLSMILMAYADAYKDKTPEEMDAAKPDWGAVFPSVVTSGLEQSIMTGVNTALQAALKGEKERDRWLINTAGALSAAVYPNTITNISKTFADENYIRETRDVSKEEGQFKAQMVNTFKDRMFMGKDLPTKVSIWGDKVNLIPDGNSWTYNLLGVSKNKKYQKYSFGTKMFELYEEYKKVDPDMAKNIFPMLPSPATKVGWDESRMTPMELQDYQIRVGQLRAEYAENYVNSEEFKEADLDEKVQTLASMYSKARKIAEKEMFDWVAYKEREGEKFQYMYDNDLLPLPSMVKKAGMYKLTEEDQEMLNDIAISQYGDMVFGKAEELNKLPQEIKVRMLNGQWTAAINVAKAKMLPLLAGKE